MRREVQDHYFRQAKRDGYRSRAAYKLIEIDDRRRLIRHGDRVLDCGCAPGSWLQVAAKRVGRKGFVVGIDLKPIRPPLPEPNVRTIEGDLLVIEAATLLDAFGADGATGIDVMLGDLAPSTTGDRTIDHHGSVRLCEAMLDRCPGLLRPGGHLVMKVLEGEAYPDLLARVRACFDRAKGFKPKASRSDSTEMYIVAQKYRGERRDDGADADAEEQADYALPPKRRPPGPGWRTG